MPPEDDNQNPDNPDIMDDGDIKASAWQLRQYANDLKAARETEKQLKVEIDATNSARRDTARAIEQQRDELRQLAAAQRAGSDEYREAQEALRQLIELQNDLEDTSKAQVRQMNDLSDTTGKLSKQVEIAKKKLADLRGVTDSIIGPFAQLRGGLASTTALIVKQAHSLEQNSVQLAQTTGYASAFHDNMVALADSSNGLNLSIQASAQIIGGLSLGYRDFNALNEETQRSLAETAGRFKHLGLDAQSSATALDLLDNSLGMTRATAHKAFQEFETMAMRVGQPIAQLVNDFNQLAPELARFGEAGKKVFEDLNKRARQLALGVKQAFDFAEMFDTFQGAADIAGKLNAQLGMQLNSTEMMAASHEERLDILRAEFAMQGLNFKEMTKREKQMVAAILQTDVGTASRLFGDPMELRKMQRDQEAQEERLARFTTAVEKLQEAFEQMFIKVEPILTKFTTIVGVLAEWMGWLAESGILVGTVIVKAMGGFTKLGEGMAKVTGGINAIAKAMARFSIIGGVFIALIEGFATGDWMYAIVQGASFTAGAIAGGILGTLAAPFLGPLAPLAPFMGSILGGILFQKLGAAMTGPADPNRFSRGSSLEPTMNDGFIQSSSQAGPMKIVKRDGTEEILNAADSALVFKPNGPFSDLFGQMGQQIRAAVTPQKSPAMPDFANRAGARLMAAAARPQAALSGGDSQGVNVSNELNLKVAMDGAPLRAKIVSEVQKMFQDGSNRTVDPGHWKLANA